MLVIMPWTVQVVAMAIDFKPLRVTFISLLISFLSVLVSYSAEEGKIVEVYVVQTGWGPGHYRIPAVEPVSNRVFFAISAPDLYADHRFYVRCYASNSAFGHMRMPAPKYVLRISKQVLDSWDKDSFLDNYISESELISIEKLPTDWIQSRESAGQETDGGANGVRSRESQIESGGAVESGEEPAAGTD